MGKVYNTQDFLAIILEYTTNISNDIKSAIIKYRDPDNTLGQWTARHDPAKKQIIYDLPQGTTLAAGDWRCYSVATMDDDRVIPGEPAMFTITVEGL